MSASMLEWTLDAIRREASDFSWMEEYRYEWVPVIQSALSRIIDGQTVLLLSDPKRMWFERYILTHINDAALERPFVPVQSLHGAFASIDEADTTDKILLLEDMLDISYPQGYFIWYIGDGSHPYTKVAYRHENNLLWLIDNEVAGSFALRSSDALLDIKLIQLYRLFDETLENAMYGKVELA